MLPEEDHAVFIGNMHRKFGEVWTHGSCVPGWTDRQTDTCLSQYLALILRAE